MFLVVAATIRNAKELGRALRSQCNESPYLATPANDMRGFTLKPGDKIVLAGRGAGQEDFLHEVFPWVAFKEVSLDLSHLAHWELTCWTPVEPLPSKPWTPDEIVDWILGA